MKEQELFNNETKELPCQRLPEQLGLYHAMNEHDACGVLCFHMRLNSNMS